ncbi:hypothetical protein JCM19992_03450 [Thermostilla marina]
MTGSKRFGFVAVLGAALLFAVQHHAAAQSLKAADWFPEETAVFLAVPDVPGFLDANAQTSGGRMMQDPKLRAFAGDLWSRLGEQIKQLEDRIGVTVDQIKEIFQGELAFGVVASENQSPAVLLLIEAKDHTDTVEKLLQAVGARMERGGAKKIEDDILGTTLITYERTGNRAREFAYFARDGYVVMGSDIEVVRGALERAVDGIATPPFAENKKFDTIATRYRSVQTENPHFVWFADPIELMRGIAVRRSQMQLTLALMPVLGLDGLTAVGGAQTFNAPPLDSVSEMHILLDEPRTGVLELINMRPGDLTPEPFVPAGASNYWTVTWDLPATYKALEKLVDGFRGEGNFQRTIADGFKESTDISLEDDLIAGATGRLSLITQVLFEGKLNPQSTAFAIEMKDEATAAELLGRVVAKQKKNLDEMSSGEITFYAVKQGDRPEGMPDEVRRPRPTFGAMGRWLVVAESVEFYREMAAVQQGTKNALADDLEFKLVLSKVKELAGNRKPSLLMYTRPEEGIRQLLNLANNPAIRRGIRAGAERGDNPFIAALAETMESNELPTPAELAKYFAPAGAFVVDDETGLHMYSFALKRKTD